MKIIRPPSGRIKITVEDGNRFYDAKKLLEDVKSIVDKQKQDGIASLNSQV